MVDPTKLRPGRSRASQGRAPQAPASQGSPHRPAPKALPARTASASHPSSSPRELDALAPRVSNFFARLKSPQDSVRLRLLEELTHFRPRDGRHYPPFFRYLLDDPAAEIRWEAARRLSLQLGPTLPFSVLKGISVPSHGVIDPQDPGSVERLRKRTRSGWGTRVLWGVEALGLVGDAPSLPVVERHLDARAPQLRLRAAMAALRLGQAQDPLDVLKQLAQRHPGRSDAMVPVLAAEGLVRAGHRAGLSRLAELLGAFDWSARSHGPQQILEDLTGTFRSDPDGWLRYLDGAKPRS